MSERTYYWVDDDGFIAAGSGGVDDDYETIAQLVTDKDAHVNLLLAAPELLASLEKITDLAYTLAMESPKLRPEVDSIIYSARAAIANAAGTDVNPRTLLAKDAPVASYYPRTLTCDMDKDCTETVTHLDNKGFAYCTAHGIERRDSRPCRKLRPHEVRRLRSGKPIKGGWRTC